MRRAFEYILGMRLSQSVFNNWPGSFGLICQNQPVIQQYFSLAANQHQHQHHYQPQPLLQPAEHDDTCSGCVHFAKSS
jgi:hypothetical protein